MVKQYPATVLCMGILLSSFAPASPYSGGSGTAEYPYLISTVEDWQGMIASVSDWDKHFLLVNDIDFDGLLLTPVAPDTDPATDGFQGTRFTGSFDGQGYLLSNAVIFLPEQDFVGLFGSLGEGGNIGNAGIVNISVTGRSRVGGLVGLNFGGVIRQCFTTGNVTGTHPGLTNAGGLAGAINSNGLVTDSYSTCVVFGVHRVGGFAGQLGSGEIRRCYAVGDVNATGDNVGGLVGIIYDPSTSGTIRSCYATGNVSGSANVGGLVGNNFRGKILHSYSIGRPIGVSGVGGLVGVIDTGPGYQGATNFWDTQTSRTTVSAMGHGRTTVQMQTQSTYTSAGWNFVKLWQMAGSQQYPSLREGGRDYSGGDGTAQQPYEIGDADDFHALTVNFFDWRSHFVLIADLDVGGVSYSKSPIAPDTSSDSGFQGTAFAGLFDGNGHVISNLRVDTGGAGHSYLGLFGRIDPGGKVTRLGIDKVIIAGGNYSTFLGGLCGNNNGGIIERCYASGTVSAGDYSIALGGLCGGNDNSGFIKDSYASGSVTGGYASFYLGGLCGRNVGVLNGSSVIENCYASVDVSAGEWSYVLGGLCGRNNQGRIYNSYSLGNVTGGNRASILGGLCGSNGDGAIGRCYAAGRVSAGMDSTSLGGLCGENLATVYSCFWDKQASGVAIGIGRWHETEGVTGITTAEMQTPGTFSEAGWEFANFHVGFCGWYVPEQSYPKFHWQNSDAAEVPIVTGKPLFEVQTQLAQAGFTVSLIRFVNSWKIPAGAVTGLNVCPGGFVDKSIPLKIYVSSGSDGDGSPARPFEIACQEDLEAVNSNLSGHYRMTSDIYLPNNLTYRTSVIAPNPAAYDIYRGTPFSGSFDGGDHVICNLDMLSSESSFIGLFGYIAPSGTVANLGIINSNIRNSRLNSGALCGINEGYIRNCYIESSTVSAASVNLNSAGGLCGRNLGVIRTCYVKNTELKIGNIFDGVAGLGLFCGVNDAGDISDCYAIGSVTGYRDNLGGFCGVNKQGSIRNSFFSGRIVRQSNPIYIGGFCGVNLQGTFSDCFWDREAGGEISGVGEGASDGVTGLSPAEMKTRLTFTNAGWDFTNESANGTNELWRMCDDGVDYPRLNWEALKGDFACPDGVNIEDLDFYAVRWLMEGCAASNNYCGGADLDYSGVVDIADLAIFAGHWLIE